MPKSHMTNENINCLKCKYYYVTWDSNMPYGCKAFGFKGTQMPSITVIQSSGSKCQAYIEKQK